MNTSRYFEDGYTSSKRPYKIYGKKVNIKLKNFVFIKDILVKAFDRIVISH